MLHWREYALSHTSKLRIIIRREMEYKTFARIRLCETVFYVSTILTLHRSELAEPGY
jgi:hypothetical protein